MATADIEVRLLNPGRLVVLAPQIINHLKARVMKLWLYVDGEGKLGFTNKPRSIDAREYEACVGSVTYRRKQNVFVLRGRWVGMAEDEFIDVFAQLGQRCVFQPPEEAEP